MTHTHSLSLSLSPPPPTFIHSSPQNGLTALDIATAVGKSAASGHYDDDSDDGDGDYDGVCELLHSHMLESAHVRSSMLCVLLPVYM